MQTIGESISRVRNVLKAVKEDPFITDRFIASVVMKYAKALIRRQDNENKIMKYDSLFEPLPCVDLIPVDKIEACCAGISTGCKIYRTKDRLPKILEGSSGPLFKDVSSLDGSIILIKTKPASYVAMANTTTFKYNKSKYYWHIDGYLYFPDIEWDAVRVEALWEGDVSFLKCDKDKQCLPMQQQPLRVPDYLMAETEQFAIKELLTMGQIPTDGSDNQQNVLR